MQQPPSIELLARWREGVEEAAEAMFHRYYARLARLIERRVGGPLGRRVDAEDVAQSAYRVFFSEARQGRFVLRRSGDLWRLLVGIGLNKLHGKVEHHTAAKRTVTDEESRMDAEIEERSKIDPRAAPPDEIAAVADVLHTVLGRAEPRARRMLELRLSGATIEEIAVAAECSERTVRRELQQIKQQLEAELLDGAS